MRERLKKAIQQWHNGREFTCVAWSESLLCCCDDGSTEDYPANERGALNELLDVILKELAAHE